MKIYAKAVVASDFSIPCQKKALDRIIQELLLKLELPISFKAGSSYDDLRKDHRRYKFLFGPGYFNPERFGDPDLRKKESKKLEEFFEQVKVNPFVQI